MTTIKDAPVVELLIGTEKFPISDGSGKPVTATIQLIINKCSGVPIVDSEDKLDPNAPQGSLASVAYDTMGVISFRDMYQPTADIFDYTNGTITTPELLTSVQKLEWTFPENVQLSGEGILFYLIPRSYSNNSDLILVMLINYIDSVVIDVIIISGDNYDEEIIHIATISGETTIYLDAIDRLNNEILTTDDWCYFSNPNGFAITEELFDIIDMFVKSVSCKRVTDLYIKEPEGYKNIFDTESTINNIAGDEKILINNGGKPSTITVNLILNKVDLSNYTTTETLNLAVQTVNSNINSFNQSINTGLQNVNQKADKADTTATNALNLAEGIQGNLSSFALKLELPTKLSQLKNNANYILDDGVIDGVYAVTADELLIDYNKADESCIGVAIVAGNHKFMLAKNDATDGTSKTLFWRKILADVSSLTNFGKADDTNVSGYLPKPDGTFGGSAHLSDDFTTWTEGALSDFDGKGNTAAITVNSSNSRDMCNVLGTFNAASDGSNAGKNDWYIPACGLLALMYLNITDINAVLAKIGGNALSSSFYWSSSECSHNKAWFMSLSNGYVISGDKYSDRMVRFVRDIEIKEVKGVKQRISDLESKSVEIENQLVNVYTKSEIDNMIISTLNTEV